ncbi:MAG: peroxiredoxin [Planctomycetaceae bacterium]|nr:peroxiredoxin [Planctomycetaceae bacterium]
MLYALKSRFTFAAMALSLGFLLTGSLQAADVNVGDKAPEFSAQDDQGQVWNSSDHVGKKVLVVYFYPADMTGGCTKQACGFRDDMNTLKDKNVEVVGVSGDTVESHQLFKKAHELNFTLLADPSGDVAKAFGVPTKEGGSIDRTVDGKDYVLTRGVTASRWTFVIDQNGKVVYKDTAVKAAEDSQTIIKLIQKLQS